MRTRQHGKPTDAHRVVGYVRVSTDEQHLGPEAQRAALQRWCDANGCALVSVLTDTGVSGGAPLDERPALMDALVDLEQSGAGVLLVAKRDRLARDTMAAGVIHREVESLGARIVSADGMGNGDEPADILMRQLLDAFAQYERAMIRARTRAALAIKRARSEFLGGPAAPYGYRLGRDGAQLEVVPSEQAAIALARSLRGAGMSLREVARQMASGGHLARSGRPFAAAQVQRMLARQEAGSEQAHG